MTGSVVITEGDPRAPDSRALLAASHALMQSLFPSESNHYLSVEALCAPDIAFLVAQVDGKTLGCGAVAAKDGYGEVKSMFVDPAARGLGIADAMMQALTEQAARLGLSLLRLETGDTLSAAIRLYEKHGFYRIGPFGDYAEDPLSLFMEKRVG